MKPIDRRSLLIGGGAGIGLIVAFLAWPRAPGSPLRAAASEEIFGPYLKVGADGRVTVALPQAETGQGAWTGLAQIAADELGADWEMVAVEPAPLSSIYANPLAEERFGVATRLTAGATSVRGFEAPLRRAAATARTMLCAAAAERWNVRASECQAIGGMVIHEAKRIGFGEVAEAAAGLAPPNDAPLRPAGSGGLVGQSLPRLDLAAKADGSLRFAADVRLPKMLFALARLAPPGGALRAFNRARGEQGGARLLTGDGWIAGLGATNWTAARALDAATPQFSGPANADSGAIEAALRAALDGGTSERFAERGDYDAATQGSRPLAATYAIGPAPHHALEPPAAAARFTGGRLELWVATQAPDLVRAIAARAAGLPEDEVTLYPMPAGDGLGAAMEAEAVPIVVALARHAGRPVSLTLSASTGQNQRPSRPPLLAKLSALPDPAGGLKSWSARIAGVAGIEAALARMAGHDAPRFAPRGAVPPYSASAVRIDAVSAALPIRSGYRRGDIEALTSFATESFIDEMARTMGVEPLAYRIGLLGGQPRLAQAILAAARIGGWDGGARGSSMGLACASAFGSHIGLLAEASLGPDQRVRVSRLVAAVDCGRVVNPGLVRQQIEGGLLSALSEASARGADYVAGMPRARPARAGGLSRMADLPRIEVELVPSGRRPGGVSGLAECVLAAAVANALFAATGMRLRRLPFDPTGAP